MPPLITFSGCNTCSLRQEWQWLKTPQMPIIPPSEPSDIRIVVIGEAPGQTEDDEGRPFVGKTGQYLRARIPVEWRNKVYWTNTIRCHPPKNRDPYPAEVACCSEYLERDLAILQPHAILGIGDFALNYFWPGAPPITRIRGIPIPIELKSGHQCWFMPTVHPSFVMRGERKIYNGNRNETVNYVEPVFRNDLKRFFKMAEECFVQSPKIIIPPKNIVYPKSAEEAWNLVSRFESTPALDYETLKLKPYERDARLLTAALSDAKTSFAFPVEWMADLNPWGKGFLKEWMIKNPKWIAQQTSFELVWTVFKIFDGDLRVLLDLDVDDTRVMGRLVNRRRWIDGLDKLSRIYLGVDIKKLTGVDRKMIGEMARYAGEPLQKLLEYNALDSWSEKLLERRLATLMTQNDWDNYRRMMPLVKSTSAMEIAGLPVDLTATEQLKDHFQKKLVVIEKDAQTIPEVLEYEKKEGKRFSLSAPQTVGHVLHDYCGCRDLPEGKHGYSIDENYLTPYVGKVQLVDARLDYAEVAKLISTYIDPILLGKLLGVDGWIHPSYTTVHTATYRLSSEDPNIQNFPKRKNKEIRGQIVAPPGFLMVAYDYGQLEARVISMASRCPGLRKAVINIKTNDIHWKWLYRIVDRYPAYMDRLAKKSGEKDEKKILKAGRTIIKTDFVFASLYGSVPGSITARTDIPLAIIEEIQGEFWAEYFGAKRWIDEQFAFYQENGFVQSLTGRIRDEILPGNEVINTPCQGTAAELVCEAQNAVFQMALEQALNFWVLPRINIHDDLIFFMPDDSDVEAKIRLAGAEIVKPRFPFINVPLTSECRVGYNWAELEEVTTFEGEYYN